MLYVSLGRDTSYGFPLTNGERLFEPEWLPTIKFETRLTSFYIPKQIAPILVLTAR